RASARLCLKRGGAHRRGRPAALCSLLSGLEGRLFQGAKQCNISSKALVVRCRRPRNKRLRCSKIESRDQRGGHDVFLACRMPRISQKILVPSSLMIEVIDRATILCYTCIFEIGRR